MEDVVLVKEDVRVVDELEVEEVELNEVLVTDVRVDEMLELVLVVEEV